MSTTQHPVAKAADYAFNCGNTRHNHSTAGVTFTIIKLDDDNYDLEASGSFVGEYSSTDEAADAISEYISSNIG